MTSRNLIIALVIANLIAAVFLVQTVQRIAHPDIPMPAAPVEATQEAPIANGAPTATSQSADRLSVYQEEITETDATRACRRALSTWLSDPDASRDWRAANGELAARETSGPYASYDDSALAVLQAQGDAEASLEAGRRNFAEYVQTGDDFTLAVAKSAFERAAVYGLPLAYLSVAESHRARIARWVSVGEIGPEELAYRHAVADSYIAVAAAIVGVNDSDIGALSGDEVDNKNLRLMQGRYMMFRRKAPDAPEMIRKLPPAFDDCIR